MKNDPNSPEWRGMFQRPSLSRFEPACETQAMLKDDLLEWFDAMHPRASAACVAFINSFVPGPARAAARLA